MTETPQLHQESFASETREVILTPEDHARLERLFLETEEHSDLFAGYRDQASVELRLRWRDEGRKAAAYLLEKLNDTPSLDNYESYQHLSLLDLCASGKDAHKIGAFLLRDDVALTEDRSFKCKSLKILERVGTQENIDQLVQFAAKCLNAPYEPYMQKLDTENALGVLYAIDMRGMPTEEENKNLSARLESARQAIRDGFSRRTGQEITDDDENALAQWVWDQDREGDFNALFEAQEYEESDTADDPDDERDMSWDDEQDYELRNDYYDHRFFETESRLETVKRLRHEVKKEQAMTEEPEDEDAAFLRRHWLEYREENPPPYAPTLGIEIEIRERTLLPPEAKNWTEKEKNKYTWSKRELFEKTEAMGVGRGNDAFWEFAHRPVRHYATLSAEVQALMEMGLINKDYQKHSLHVTLGGVTSVGQGGEGAFVLARALESTGWGTTGGRIMRPYLLQRGAWTYKGEAGVKERSKDEIALGGERAIEIRTMQVQGLAGLDRLLRSSYLLGAALRAHQEKERGDILASADTDGTMRDGLANIWGSFTKRAKNRFEAYGLTDPSVIWTVPNNTHRADEPPSGDFVPFAALLDDARKHPKGDGAEFVAAMRGLIIETRKQIFDLIYPSAA